MVRRLLCGMTLMTLNKLNVYLVYGFVHANKKLTSIIQKTNENTEGVDLMYKLPTRYPWFEIYHGSKVNLMHLMLVKHHLRVFGLVVENRNCCK